MNSEEGAALVARTLHQLGVGFMVVGSFSSNVYSVARSTLDADFVIESDRDINAIRDALAPVFHMHPQVGFETKLMTTRYEFFHQETDFKVELFVLSEDPHDQLRFRQRVKVERGDQVMYFPRAEDVIIQKLRWARKKDQMDVAAIVKRQGDRLDWSYIHEWCERHGTRSLLDQIRAEP